jgi:hypothetical protein
VLFWQVFMTLAGGPNRSSRAAASAGCVLTQVAAAGRSMNLPPRPFEEIRGPYREPHHPADCRKALATPGTEGPPGTSPVSSGFPPDGATHMCPVGRPVP